MKLLEIELKVKLNENSEANLLKFIADGGIAGKQVREEDHYLDRDFEIAKKDEAVRIRSTVREGKKSVELTHKGPKLSNQVKSRREITIRLEEHDVDSVLAFFTQLGFDPIGKVKKNRTYWTIKQDGWTFLVSLDEVEELGRYLEIETSSNMDNKSEAERRVSELLHLLLGDEAGKSKSILMSYLELVLAKRGNLQGF